MVRRLPFRLTLPLGLALLLFVVLGVSLMSALDKRLEQLDQQARLDLLTETAHLARMADQGWETSRGLVESDLAQTATDPRTASVLLLDDTGRVWRGTATPGAASRSPRCCRISTCAASKR